MSSHPAPLTPADCDLRNFQYMGLDVVRLRDSDTALIDAEAFRAAVISWCVAWHQVPAASLPNDDVLLCRLLGYGRDMKGWQRVRAAGALRGYIECSDGRLYHPVVAEKAIASWQSKSAQRNRTEAARRARLLQRRGNAPNHEATDETTTINECVTTSVTEKIAPEKLSKGEERIKQESEQSFQTQSPREPPKTVNGHHWRANPEHNLVEANSGRELCGGWYWDEIWPRIADAARIDQARFLGTEMPAREWLREGIDPDLIVEVVERMMRRPPSGGVGSLNFFSKQVRDAHRSKRP